MRCKEYLTGIDPKTKKKSTLKRTLPQLFDFVCYYNDIFYDGRLSYRTFIDMEYIMMVTMWGDVGQLSEYFLRQQEKLENLSKRRFGEVLYPPSGYDKNFDSIRRKIEQKFRRIISGSDDDDDSDSSSYDYHNDSNTMDDDVQQLPLFEETNAAIILGLNFHDLEKMNSQDALKKIEKQFRILILQSHPDKQNVGDQGNDIELQGKDDKAHEESKKIIDSREVLKKFFGK